MNQEQNQVPSTLVPVKRVRRETGKGKAGDQEQIVLTFGLDKEGGNGLDNLIEALTEYKGKQVNFDVRISKKQSQGGASYDSAFVLVKEMIPRGAGAPTQFTPKANSKQEKIRANAKKFSNGIE